VNLDVRATTLTHQLQQTVLRRPAVEAATGLSRSTLYEMMDKGTFPRPIKLGAKAVGWPSAEIDAWLAARIAERDAA
jgi:prophage regulatory protein